MKTANNKDRHPLPPEVVDEISEMIGHIDMTPDQARFAMYGLMAIGAVDTLQSITESAKQKTDMFVPYVLSHSLMQVLTKGIRMAMEDNQEDNAAAVDAIIARAIENAKNKGSASEG